MFGFKVYFEEFFLILFERLFLIGGSIFLNVIFYLFRCMDCRGVYFFVLSF